MIGEGLMPLPLSDPRPTDILNKSDLMEDPPRQSNDKSPSFDALLARLKSRFIVHSFRLAAVS